MFAAGVAGLCESFQGLSSLTVAYMQRNSLLSELAFLSHAPLPPPSSLFPPSFPVLPPMFASFLVLAAHSAATAIARAAGNEALGFIVQ